MEEVRLDRYERISTGRLADQEAILEYVRQVANPDYIHCPKTKNWSMARHRQMCAERPAGRLP